MKFARFAPIIALALIFAWTPDVSLAQQDTQPRCTLTANTNTVQLGGTVNLRWQSINAIGGTITSIGSVGPSGVQGVIPTKTTEYVGNFTGPNGSARCSVRITVTYPSAGQVRTIQDFVGDTTNICGVSSDQLQMSYRNRLDESGNVIGRVQEYLDSNGRLVGGNVLNQEGVAVGTLGCEDVSVQTQTTQTQTNQTQTGGTPLPQVPSTGNTQLTQSQTGTGQGLAQVCRGIDCQACHLAKLIQNVINFLILLALPIAAILIAVAGFLYFTSADNPGNRNRAKDILKKALIGFLIALTSWLVVNTIISALFNTSRFPGGTWYRIQCIQDLLARPTGTSVQQWLNAVLGMPQSGGTMYAACSGDYPNRQPETGQCCTADWGSCIQSPVTSIPGQPGGNPENVCSQVRCPGNYVCKEDANEYWCENPTNPNDWEEAPPLGRDYCLETGTCPQIESFDVKNGGFVSAQLAPKLDNFCGKLDGGTNDQVGCGNVQVTEACPPTSNHVNQCHAQCGCVDIALREADYTPANVQYIQASANQAGLRCVFETTDSCSGLTSCASYPLCSPTSGRPCITGPHFSCYQQ